jgi:formate hydrogenlyase subunit 3/multisubunit Na+/H+ antiporter MnhD subunit
MAGPIIEVIGWMGAVLIPLAYFLLVQKRTRPDSITYHSLNLVGSAGIIVNALANNAYPSAALNIVWGFIAVYGLVKGLAPFKK